MRSIFGCGSDELEEQEENDALTPTADWHTPESLPSDADSEFNPDYDDDDTVRHQSDSALHFPTPSPTRSLSSQESDSESSSSRHPRKRKRRYSISLQRQHLESAHTIQQHKNLLKSIETEFAGNLTGHIWSAILIKRKQREKEERKRNGLPMDSTDQDSDDSDAPPPPKRRPGRPRLSGPDYTTHKLVTKAWTSWPLPYGQLPPLPPSTSIPLMTSPEPPPHPLEEAITALFLLQSTESLRSQSLPVSDDETVSAHMLKPIVGGILAKLDRLLLSVYESNHVELRGESTKVAKGRILRRVPMGWSEVLGLAGLTGWDKGWGGDGATGKSKRYGPTGVRSHLGPVGRATERMCNVLGEKIEFRLWPEESLDATSSHYIHNGVHKDGFLELIPAKGEREERKRQKLDKQGVMLNGRAISEEGSNSDVTGDNDKSANPSGADDSDSDDD